MENELKINLTAGEGGLFRLTLIQLKQIQAMNELNQERIARVEQENAELKAQVARLTRIAPPKEEELYEEGRCQVCGWSLMPRMDEGCTPESCSMRPVEGSPEWYRLKERREWLAARAKGDKP